jgi:predicted nucleotidyltransferase
MNNDEYGVLLQALSKAFGASLKTVVLFGSRARQDATPDSDHDIFIIVAGLPANPLGRHRQVREALRECLADLPGTLNLRSKTPSEFEADLAPLYLDICVDGICLFGREYFEPFRQKALTALASSRMQRKRVGRSLYWMLPEEAAHQWELTWDGYRERF